MSFTVRTRPDSTSHDEFVAALDGHDDHPAGRPTDAFGRVWHFLTSMRVGLALILALGLLSLVGTLVPQADATALSGPGAYAAWLDSMRPRYGGWTDIMSRLAAFTVFHSLLFKAIVVLLATSIIACSINRAPRLWKHARHPRTTMGEAFFHAASLHGDVELDLDADAAFERSRQVLRHHHFRTIDGGTLDDGTRQLYADRFRWGPIGTIIAHLSFVVILLGFVVSTTVGFKDDGFAVPVGERLDVGNGTGLTVEATAFRDSYYQDGSPKDYASDLVLYRDGVVVQQQTVRVNEPMRFDGISVYQSFYGVAASLQVRDAAGRPVFDGGVPLKWQSDDGTQSIGRISLPQQGLTVFVVAPASGRTDPAIKAGQVQLQVYPSGMDQPVAVQVVDQGRATTIAGLTYTFQRTRQFTGLIVSRDPGAWLVWLGSALLVLGIVMVFFFPHRRIWVRVRRSDTGSQVSLASSMRRDLTFETQFRTIIHDLPLAGTRSSSHV